jgi:serine/threonine protein kinase
MCYLTKNIKLEKKNIDDFEEKEDNLLGKGASGKVYRYSSLKNGDCILKMMSYNDWESHQEFEQDIVWQSMLHEELNKLESSIKLYGYSEYCDKSGQKYLCFIMEYKEDYEDCFYFIENRNNWSKEIKTPYKRKDKYNNDVFYRVNRNFKLKVIKNILNGLKDIHDIGIVHGDIKTNNLIINSLNGDVKFIDFGAGIFIESGRKYMETDWTHGTLGYRAPEEDQNNLLGFSSDIYSLAVTIIEIWNGNIWYSGNSFKKCRNELLRSLRILEKEEKMGVILRKCISMDGRKRPNISKLISFFQDYS